MTDLSMIMRPGTILLLVCLLHTGKLNAQEEVINLDTSANIVVDSVPNKKQPGVLALMFKGKPGRALAYSLIIPGGGQVYNKKYWKVPIVYAGLGVAGYFIYFNNKEYKRYDSAFRSRVDFGDASMDEFQGRLSLDGINSFRKYHDKYLQMSYIGFSIVYILGGIEAFVDRHLLDFDVSDKLGFYVKPSYTELGLSLCLHLKK